MTQDIEM